MQLSALCLLATDINLSTDVLPFLIAPVLRLLNGAKLASKHWLCLIKHPVLLACLPSVINATPR